MTAAHAPLRLIFLRALVALAAISFLAIVGLLVARNVAWRAWGDEDAITFEFVPKNEGISYPVGEDRVTLTAQYERTRRILFITEDLLEFGGAPKLQRSFEAKRGTDEVFVAEIPTHLRSIMGWELRSVEVKRSGGSERDAMARLCKRTFLLSFDRADSVPFAAGQRRGWIEWGSWKYALWALPSETSVTGSQLRVAFHCAEEDPTTLRDVDAGGAQPMKGVAVQSLPLSLRRIQYEVNYSPLEFPVLEDVRRGDQWTPVPPEGLFDRDVGAWLVNEGFGINGCRARPLAHDLAQALVAAPGSSVNLSVYFLSAEAPGYKWTGDDTVSLAAVPLAAVGALDVPSRGVVARPRWQKVLDAQDRGARIRREMRLDGPDGRGGVKYTMTLHVGETPGGPWVVYMALSNSVAAKDVFGIMSFGLLVSWEARSLAAAALERPDRNEGYDCAGDSTPRSWFN